MFGGWTLTRFLSFNKNMVKYLNNAMMNLQIIIRRCHLYSDPYALIVSRKSHRNVQFNALLGLICVIMGLIARLIDHCVSSKEPLSDLMT